jgi:hypothetical protein
MIHEPTIRQRCRRIARLLRSGQGNASENLIDLLADARHWCDHNAQDFAALDRQAYQHYIAEIDACRKESRR